MSWYPKGYKEPIKIEEIIQRIAKLSRDSKADYLARYGGDLPESLRKSDEEIKEENKRLIELTNKI